MDAHVMAMGMSSCLGPVVTACAAFRAGIRLARASLDADYFAADSNEAHPLDACAIPSSTFGFSGIGRLVAILHETLVDLRCGMSAPALDPETRVYLALPDPVDLELPVEPEVAGIPRKRTDALGRCVLAMTLQTLGLTHPKANWRFFSGGHTAFARALEAATKELGRGRQESCLVVAVDSLLDPVVREGLLMEGRLKTRDHPVGFTPGEAGVAVLLRPDPAISGASKKSGPKVILRRLAIASATAATQWNGQALASCVEQLLPFLEPDSAAPTLISDHTGEENRASEWGSLRVRLKAVRPAWDTPAAWFPTIGFGETGCASAAIGLCVAARAFERGYAPSRHCIVLSSSEGGQRAALLMERKG